MDVLRGTAPRHQREAYINVGQDLHQSAGFSHRLSSPRNGPYDELIQPNVNEYASTPESRNSISNCRSEMGLGCRIS
jgi:hypothetical protein